MIRCPVAACAALLLVALALATGCEDASRATAVIDRETFVESYVALRVAALQRPGSDLSGARRDSVLEAHGVTEEELLAFAEAYGGNVPAMNDIWAEIQARMDSLPAGGG